MRHSLSFDVRFRIAALALAAATLLAPSSFGSQQIVTTCQPEWLPTFGAPDTIDGTVRALARFDDGSGLALYAGGSFSNAGGGAVNHVAKWDGSSWSALAGGVDGDVRALTVFDDGTGAALYAAGDFANAGGAPANHIAKWNGTSWSALGSGTDGTIHALTVHDQGSGAALYAGGSFLNAGGASANRIARWNGSSWSTLLSGMNDEVRALAVFDSGAGPELYAGGWFAQAGGSSAARIAKWNGTFWLALSSGMNTILGPSNVFAITTYDDGSGTALYAGGYFTSAGGVGARCVARWNGTTWSPLGVGPTNPVEALAVFDDGSGSALYAGGWFTSTENGTASHVAKWDGASWSAVGSGTNGDVYALVAHDDGSCTGTALFAGGAFTNAPDSGDAQLAKWDCPPPPSGCFGPFCAGDGIDPNVWTACPCANFGAPGHGCGNSVNSAGALLTASGTAQTDTVVLAAVGMPATASCLYFQGDAVVDAIFGDGVRCAGGTLIRLRTKINVGGASQYPDASDTETLSQRGGVTPGSGVTRYYQAYYRNVEAGFCPPAPSNVSNGWVIVW